jgi:hypothetical protein
MSKSLFKKSLPLLLTAAGLVSSEKAFTQNLFSGGDDSQNVFTLSLSAQGSTPRALGKDFSPVQFKTFGVSAEGNMSNLAGIHGLTARLSTTLPMAGSDNPDATNRLIVKNHGGVSDGYGDATIGLNINIEGLMKNAEPKNDFDAGVIFGVRAGVAAFHLKNGAPTIIAPEITGLFRINMGSHLFMQMKYELFKYNGSVANGLNDVDTYFAGGNSKWISNIAGGAGFSF